MLVIIGPILLLLCGVTRWGHIFSQDRWYRWPPSDVSVFCEVGVVLLTLRVEARYYGTDSVVHVWGSQRESRSHRTQTMQTNQPPFPATLYGIPMWLTQQVEAHYYGTDSVVPVWGSQRESRSLRTQMTPTTRQQGRFRSVVMWALYQCWLGHLNQQSLSRK